MGTLPNYVDVLIVGAGLSGIGSACHLEQELPHKTYAIVESRAVSGGTWDLFRYPAVRSDSDMFTLGYSFSPWTDPVSLASGPAILSYIRDTASRFGVDKKMFFQRRVVSASWSSATARWSVHLLHADSAAPETIECGFLWGNTGYYRYDEGYRPEFPGESTYTGPIIHPQHWPEGLDVTGKNVVVIGSGATAVTLVPALAQTAARVTMLQRTPTWVVSRPYEDGAAKWLMKRLPVATAYKLARAKNVTLGLISYQITRRRPELIKKALRKGLKEALPVGYDIRTHFSPPYNPWDQRLCLVPDGDLFAAISSGAAEVVTDTIETFTATGIRLHSGRELPADLVVSATGLNMQLLGGIDLEVDGVAVDYASTIAYKGIMLSGVPNLAMTFGYTNASWTLKADLTSRYVVRLLRLMDRRRVTMCVPQRPGPDVEARKFMDLDSGYINRVAHLLPKQGSKRPWRLHNNYLRDTLMLKRGRLVNDLTLSSPQKAK